ncbi:hypothetical protein HD554DRAFT_2041170 [Boletus coccyginus]|nr:hypothetical protein HD554DRAFT_2041170 [Boletus coccyginus]
MLEVGAECPIPILIKFLLKHQVWNLRIAPRNYSMTVLFTVKLHPQLHAPVPSLTVLDGQVEELLDCAENFVELEELRVMKPSSSTLEANDKPQYHCVLCTLDVSISTSSNTLAK